MPRKTRDQADGVHARRAKRWLGCGEMHEHRHTVGIGLFRDAGSGTPDEHPRIRLRLL